MKCRQVGQAIDLVTIKLQVGLLMRAAYWSSLSEHTPLSSGTGFINARPLVILRREGLLVHNLGQWLTYLLV